MNRTQAPRPHSAYEFTRVAVFPDLDRRVPDASACQEPCTAYGSGVGGRSYGYHRGLPSRTETELNLFGEQAVSLCGADSKLVKRPGSKLAG